MTDISSDFDLSSRKVTAYRAFSAVAGFGISSQSVCVVQLESRRGDFRSPAKLLSIQILGMNLLLTPHTFEIKNKFLYELVFRVAIKDTIYQNSFIYSLSMLDVGLIKPESRL